MLNRRNLIKGLFLLLTGLFNRRIFALNTLKMNSFHMPEEASVHKQTWMAFVANDYIWSKKQIPKVKQDLALLATTIAKYEPVSMLVSSQDYDEAVALIKKHGQRNYPINLIKFSVDDLWLRDTGPTFVIGSDGNKYAIDFNFNGWGGKQVYARDKNVADFICNYSNAIIKKSSLTLEGGSIEVDGVGTSIMTKSSIINNNRNPELSLQEIEQELKTLLGLKKIIWLPGIKGKDITDGHVDFYARFAKPGQVIVSKDNYPDSFDYKVTRQNIEILKKSLDAKGNKLKITVLDTPDYINEDFATDDFAASYLGFYLCNNGLIMQKFGDPKADLKAKRVLQKIFPDRVIEQIAIDGIASGGGSIHCTTQQEIIAL